MVHISESLTDHHRQLTKLFYIVVVQTLEESRTRQQHFTVDVLHEDSIIKSLILAVNQSQPTAHASLYIDCVAYGMVATPKSLRDMYTSMKRPFLEVVSYKVKNSTTGLT